MKIFRATIPTAFSIVSLRCIPGSRKSSGAAATFFRHLTERFQVPPHFHGWLSGREQVEEWQVPGEGKGHTYPCLSDQGLLLESGLLLPVPLLVLWPKSKVRVQDTC